MYFLGDFINYVNALYDSNTLHFLELLNIFNLVQHVSLRTLDSVSLCNLDFGHILDFIINNVSSKLVTSFA